MLITVHIRDYTARYDRTTEQVSIENLQRQVRKFTDKNFQPVIFYSVLLR